MTELSCDEIIALRRCIARFAPDDGSRAIVPPAALYVLTRAMLAALEINV